jgi:flagellin-specific chaperone FliS
VNPYAAARGAYTESSVLTASPERLVVKLYDGAIRFLYAGAAAARDIYSFCSRHLIDSTLNANPAGCEEVAKLLAELREAWDQSTNQLVAAAAAAGA